MKEFSDLSENEKFQELFRLMGLCLFGSQRIEFIFQAIIGLFSNQFVGFPFLGHLKVR